MNLSNPQKVAQLDPKPKTLPEYIFNPNPNVEEAVNYAEETGISRLEITFCLHNTEEILTKHFITNEINYLENLILSNLICYNSVDNQLNLS